MKSMPHARFLYSLAITVALLFMAVAPAGVARADTGPIGTAVCPTLYNGPITEPVFPGPWWPLPEGWDGTPCTLGPLAAQPVAHTWYTSTVTDARAFLYYCDDDPDLAANVIPADREPFPTVAALLAKHPGRRLNHACKDGATGS